MDDETQSENPGSDKGIPVSAQCGCDGVVCIGRNDNYEIHQTVEHQKQDEKQTRDTHNQLPSDRRINQPAHKVVV